MNKIPQYIYDAFVTLKNPLSSDATLDTLIKDVIQDSLEYYELLAELGLPDDPNKFKTIGDLNGMSSKEDMTQL